MIEGYIDRVRANKIEGWVWNSFAPDLSISIGVFDENEGILAVGLANIFRDDIFQAHKGSGAYGFELSLPLAISLKGVKIIAFEYDYELIGSPLFSTTEKKKCLLPLDIKQKMAVSFGRVKALSDYIESLEQKYSYQFLKLNQRLHDLNTQFAYSGQEVYPKTNRQCVDIIIFPPIDWSYRIQRPQRLAIELARLGFRVWYISPQMLPLVDGSPPYIIYDEPSPNLFLVKMRCVYPYVEINKAPLNGQNVELVSHALSVLMNTYQLLNVCYLVGSVGWGSLFKNIGYKQCIYDCMDWHQGFSATSPQFLEAEKELGRHAQLVICSSSSLKVYCEHSFNRNEVVLIRNATDVNLFSTMPAIRKDRSVIGYIGAIEHWFNEPLIIDVANALPEMDFILVGHISDTHNKLKNSSNIQCMGECTVDQLEFYIEQFDVGIIPFIDNDLTRHTDPVKVYEYLAAGRPVVSTPLPEIERLQPEVKIAKTTEQFIQYIKESIKDAYDITSIINKKNRVMYETWSIRATLIQSLIFTKIINSNE